MKTFTIVWLNKCRCGNKSHTVKTARGNESALWDEDAVKCNSCGRGGVIQVCEGQARVLWETDEEMAEGKPMSELTKEWLLKTIAELEEERDATPGAVNEDASNALAAMKLALASLGAEAMTQVLSSRAGNDTSTIDKALPEGTVLYTAPPAPVVPDAISTRQAIAQMENHEPCDSINVAYKFGWNACRAAMLQGADGI